MRIKICGITTVADALAAVELGADALGLNFYAGSKRHVYPEEAVNILRTLPPFVEPVGVFVNQSAAAILRTTVNLPRLHSFQLHADQPEPPPDTPHRWITAFPVADQQSLAALDAYLERCREHGRLPDAILVDGKVAGEYGGTGQVAPWRLLADYRSPVPLIVAGGLTPDNVAEAVRLVRPYAVDVASGVEISPGKKDRDKMRRFIEQAWGAFSLPSGER